MIEHGHAHNRLRVFSDIVAGLAITAWNVHSAKEHMIFCQELRRFEMKFRFFREEAEFEMEVERVKEQAREPQ